MARKANSSVTGNGQKKAIDERQNQRSVGKLDVELGQRIRLRRVEQHISQSELADKLGVSFQQVQNMRKVLTASALLDYNRSRLPSMCL